MDEPLVFPLRVRRGSLVPAVMRRTASGSLGPSPRMCRRGAVCYDDSDATAQYIRHLGNAVNCELKEEDLAEQLPPPRPKNLNLIRAHSGRRGSLSPPSFYRRTAEEPILQSVNVEVFLENNMARVDCWSFDVFTFRTLAAGRPLFHLGLHLFKKHDLIDIMHLDVIKLMQFLALVEGAYHSDNSYHNSTHATDVSQALNCLLCEPKLMTHVTNVELLAAFLAAMTHDVDHPGVNQNYLINTSSHLAHLHGNNSLLEHHHFSQARGMLLQTGLLEHLPEEDRVSILGLMKSMIIATDVTHHAYFMNEFKDMLKSKETMDLSVQKNRHFMLTIAIKAADISNPARTFNLSKVWSEQIMDEFFKQGDKERQLNLPISNYCDRYTTVVPISQKSFFGFVCAPLFETWSKFFDSRLSRQLCANIAQNKYYWETMADHIETSVTDEIGDLPKRFAFQKFGEVEKEEKEEPDTEEQQESDTGVEEEVTADQEGPKEPELEPQEIQPQELEPQELEPQESGPQEEADPTEV